MIRSDILNQVRYNIGLSLVDYVYDASWETSAAATDQLHSETILQGDLQKAMNHVAADSRDKWERRMLRLIATQYEYPLPSDCMTLLEVAHNFYGDWNELDYFYHNEFYMNFSTNVQSYPPERFTLQAKTSNPVHYTGTITTANADSPPVLIDTSANFGITLTGEDINPGDKIFNITDDSTGYVDYLSVGTWTVSGGAITTGGTTSLVTSADISGLSVGDILNKIGSSDTYAIISSISGSTISFSRLYNDENTGFAVSDTFNAGTADRIYLTSSGLVADTEEGLVGGAEGDFDEDDSYQVEDYYSTLDTLLLGSVPGQSDTLGTETLLIVYVPYPKFPLKYWHPIELSDAYEDALVAKMMEYARKREHGEAPQYEWLLDKAIGRRKLYNKGRLGHKRTHIKGRTSNIISWQDTNLVDHRGI